MEKYNFQAKKTVKNYTQYLVAKPNVVFPLLCPVREYEWLDGWNYSMIYSQSGVIEECAVFTTSHQSEEDTVWIVTKYDPNNYQIEFTRFTPQSHVCVLKIDLQSTQNHHSKVDITYIYIATSSKGNEFIDNFTDENFLSAVTFWEDSLNHFLKTGEKLLKKKEK